MTYYRPYDYHEADTSPANYNTTEIFGVELEADNRNSARAELLDIAIEENIITVPHNEGETMNLKVMEEDGSVWREIILNADTFENLLERIACLNDYGINPENFDNSAGTSCHIHINRRHLMNHDITEQNIYKMFEFFAPIIFRMSGRTLRQFERWSRSQAEHELTLNFVDWKQRGELISRISLNHNRYQLVNLNRSNTIEMRGFSNRCSFDYTTIKFYLEFIRFILDECEYMKGKYYAQEGENLIQHFLDWIPQQKYIRFNLGLLFEKDISLKRLQDLQESRYLMDSLHDAVNGNMRTWQFVEFITHPQQSELISIVENYPILKAGSVQRAGQKILNVIGSKQGEYMNVYYENKCLLNKLMEE